MRLLITSVFLSLSVIPNSYKLSTRAASVDESSEDGRCSLLSNLRDGGQRCRTPYGSVLFDGVIPSFMRLIAVCAGLVNYLHSLEVLLSHLTLLDQLILTIQ